MNEKGNDRELNARDLANVDPYNRRRIGARDAAKELLGGEVSGTETTTPTSEAEGLFQREEFVKKLAEDEKKQWQKILGPNVVVYRPPDCITPDVVKALKEHQMSLRFIPKSRTAKDGEFTSLFRPEDMISNQIGNWSNARTFTKDIWERVKKGTISGFDTPSLIQNHGVWIAIESRSGRDGNGYLDKSVFPFSDLLNITSRRMSFTEVEDILAAKSLDIRKELQLSTNNTIIRMPTAHEYNLLMNRDEFSGLEQHDYESSKRERGGEWTITNSKAFLGNKNLVMGFPSDLGAADVEYVNPTNSRKVSGFRIAVEFEDDFKDPGPVIGIDL